MLVQSTLFVLNHHILPPFEMDFIYERVCGCIEQGWRPMKQERTSMKKTLNEILLEWDSKTEPISEAQLVDELRNLFKDKTGETPPAELDSEWMAFAFSE